MRYEIVGFRSHNGRPERRVWRDLTKRQAADLLARLEARCWDCTTFAVQPTEAVYSLSFS
jgi:hypothetical protein